MQNPYEARLIRVLDHIHAHPAGDLSLDALAEIAAMSRFHWHRVYRGLTGETVAQAVRRIRLHLAAGALLRSDQPVAEIVRSVGYPDAASFSRAFAGHYGCAPRDFRSRHPAPLAAQPCFAGETMTYPVEITTLPGYRLAALPHRGNYMGIGAAFEKASGLLSARGLGAEMRGMIGIYYDNPAETPVADLNSHAGVILGPQVEIGAPFEELILPPGRHGVLHHKGPYATLEAGYKQLYGGWLPQSGEEPADRPPFEIYLNAPHDTAPEDLLTDICLPLKG